MNPRKRNTQHTLYLEGRALNSLTLIQSPIRVAIEQWGIVGVNSIRT